MEAFQAVPSSTKMNKLLKLITTAALVAVISGCAQQKPAGPPTKWGFIDKQGKFIILPQFDGASEFTKDGAIVLNGKRLMRLQPETFVESSLPVGPDDKAELPPTPTFKCAEAGPDKYKVLDGEEVIFEAGSGKEPPAALTDTGFLCAQFGSKYGFIDKDGKLAFGRPFDQARPFSQGRAAVLESGKWGFINKKGDFVLKPIYLEAGSFHSGLAPVKVLGDAPPPQ